MFVASVRPGLFEKTSDCRNSGLCDPIYLGQRDCSIHIERE